MFNLSLFLCTVLGSALISLFYKDAQYHSLLEKYKSNDNEVSLHTDQNDHHLKICKQ